MLNYIIPLSKKLISVKTDPDNQAALYESLDIVLDELGEFTIETFDCEGVRSALVYNTKTRPEKFRVLLNCHLDVIPGKEEQYVPRIEGNRLYGCGAMDMKANLVTALKAFKDVAGKSHVPMAIQFVTDEEIGGFQGTKYQVDNGVRADFVLATEPTNFDIVYKAKGITWIRLTAKGTTAHGAYPWRGDNAIEKMQEALRRIQLLFPNPTAESWVTTVNVATIHSTNDAYNKLPDNCTAGLDIRYIAEDEETLIDNISALLPDGVTLEVLVKEPALATSEQQKDVQQVAMIGKKITGNDLTLRGANGTSDARHFAPYGAACIEFGPIGEGIGSDNEWVDISSLETYYEILKEMLETIS